MVYLNPKIKKYWYWFVVFIAVVVTLFSKHQIEIGNSHWGEATNIWPGDNPTTNPNGPVDPHPMPEPEDDRLDLLLMGLRGMDDKSITEEGGLLTDSMMLISLNTRTKQASIISIPRDIYIDMTVQAKSGQSVTIRGKLNEVYERGLGKSDGLGVTQKVFSRLTGIYVDNVAVFDFTAFQSIIDSLGGIDIYLAREFREPSQFGYEFYLPAGNNHLSGEQALYYVRSRFTTSDFDRARRQQQVFAAMRSKALSLGLLSDSGKILAIYKTLRKNITTDLSVFQIQDTYALAKTFNPKSGTNNFVMSTDNLLNEGKAKSGDYILSPKAHSTDSGQAGDWSEIRQVFADYGIWVAPSPKITNFQ